MTNYPGTIGFKLYNPEGVKSQSHYLIKNKKIVFNTPKAGHYQLGVFRLKGTARPSKIKLLVTPLKIELASKALIKGKEKLFLISHNKEPIRGDILIRLKKEIIEEKFVTFKGNNELTLSSPFSFQKKGEYTLSFKPLYPEEWSYQRESCLHVFKNTEDATLLMKWGKTFTNLNLPHVQPSHKVLKDATSIHFYCRLFDSFEKPNYEIPFTMSLNFSKLSPPLLTPISLKRGYNKISFEKDFFKDSDDKKSLDIFFKVENSTGDNLFLGNLPVIIN